MKLQTYIKKIDTKEVVTCLLLIVVGYMTAQLFMRKYNGFRVGGQNSCYFGNDMTCKLGTFPQNSGKNTPNSDPCSKVNADDCNKSWWQSKTDGGGNNKTPIGIACKYENNKCFTPGTGFHSISGCPTKSCNGSANSPSPSPSPSPPSPTPTPTPTASCSSTGFFSADKCLKNGSAVSDPSNDPYCKDLKDANGDDCQYNAFIKHWILYSVSIALLILILILIIYFSI